MRIFAGAERSHGTYAEEDAEPGGKRTIKRTATTVRSPATVALWKQHLAGAKPLGIVPIREDDACLWGAVDVDDYTIVVADLAAAVVKAGIPAIVCRTKSGGAHVYLFFSEPISAAEVVPRLRELAAALGHGDSEIFPKQMTVLAERGDLGSWLNMPYYGGDATTRHAVRPDGRGVTAAAFLDLAESVRLSRRGLHDLRLSQPVEGFGSGPPCLESLVATGFPPGTRNSGVLGLGILAKKMSPENWEALLRDWVREHGGDPPFPPQELDSIIRSLRKKDYNYKCTEKPLSMRCNVALCRTREHGVNGHAGSVSILESASVLKTETPVYFVVLKTGQTVEITSHQLLNVYGFRLAATTQHHIIMPLYKQTDWTSWTQKIMENAIHIEVPKESSSGGRFMELLDQFVTSRSAAETRDSIVQGVPWLDTEHGIVHFRIQDLERSLELEKFASPTRDISLRSWLTARLREMGGTSDQFKVKGKNVRTWRLREDQFSWQTEPLDTPDTADSPL